jgi:threonine/homoserine efflux transporter RhtA
MDPAPVLALLLPAEEAVVGWALVEEAMMGWALAAVVVVPIGSAPWKARRARRGRHR